MSPYPTQPLPSISRFQHTSTYMEGHGLPVAQRAVVDRHQHSARVVAPDLLGRHQELGRGRLGLVARGGGLYICFYVEPI